MTLKEARKLAVVCLGLLAIGTASCASKQGTTPYSTQTERARDPLRAQELTAEAFAVMPKDIDRAESLLREALAADLYHGPAHNNLGVLYLNQGKLYEAASEFEWARKLMPGHPDPRMNLALTLERAGRIDEALETYAAALAVYPGHLPTMQALTRCQLRHGRQDPEIGSRLETIALESGSERWREWARERLAVGRHR